MSAWERPDAFAPTAAETTAQACCDVAGEAGPVRADRSQDAHFRRMGQAALEARGRTDGLVSNAGTTRFVGLRDVEGLSAEDSRRSAR